MLLGAAALTGQQQAANETRESALERYFREIRSPLAALAPAFIAAADSHGIDWRLLPAISVVESGAGRKFRNNNVFGWNGGRAEVANIVEGIWHVASRLAQSPIYAGKDSLAKLRAYNPRHPEYALRVLTEMARVSR